MTRETRDGMPRRALQWLGLRILRSLRYSRGAMEDKPGFPPPLRRELVRLGALEVGLRRGLRWEEQPNGHWRVSCETAFRRDASDRILSDLGRLPDGAGWNAAWEALFSFPESPC